MVEGRWPRALLVVALVVLGHGHCSTEHQAEAVEEIGPDEDASRLLNPGSASDSPAVTAHNRAMKQRVKLARKMAQDFRSQPHHMVQELREDASTVHHTLVEDAQRDRRAQKDAIAAQKLFQGAMPHLSEEEFELLSSTPEARQPEQNDLGESDEVGANTVHKKKVWSYEFARKVSPDVIHKEQAAAEKEYHHLTAKKRMPSDSHIRAEAKRIAKEQSQDDNMRDLMHAERRDENAVQVAKNADGAMEMQGFDALQQQKLAAMRASVQAVSSTLGEAESKLDSFERRVQTNMGHEKGLKTQMSLALGEGEGAHDLGQGMDANEDQGARTLAVETSKYRKARRDYAIRSQWGRGSVVQAYSVELQKWCGASVLSRKKRSLHVKFDCSGYGEWLPETSKRLRASPVAHDHDLGQSLGSKSTALAGTLSRTQVSELNTQLDRTFGHEENAERLVTALKTETAQLKDSIKQHLSFKRRPVDVGGHSEFFIAPDATAKKRKTHTNAKAEEEEDLGEGQEIGDARSFDQKSLAAHRAGAVQALFDHRQAVANENARTTILKSQMEDIEKKAMQHEVLAAAKVTTLAKQAGAHQVLLAKALAKLDAKKKRQIRRVQQKARSSVWSSYQASLQAKQREVVARAHDTEKALQREAKFKYKLGDKLTKVLQKADALVADGGRVATSGAEAELTAQQPPAEKSGTK